MNKNMQFKYVSGVYDYFKDLGNSYSMDKKLDTGDQTSFILVYRVDSNLDNDKYVLYYSDVSKNILLKKTKLDVKDMRDVKTVSEVQLNNKMTFKNKNTLTITDAKIDSSAVYNKYTCIVEGCSVKSQVITLQNSKILKISFVSNNFTGESFVDFSSIYAKIKYEDKDGNIKEIDTSSVIDGYNGNYAYFNIPNDIDVNSYIDLIFTFRNERYVYHLIKGGNYD